MILESISNDLAVPVRRNDISPNHLEIEKQLSPQGTSAHACIEYALNCLFVLCIVGKSPTP